MIQARCELDLAQKALRAERRGKIGMKDLERDYAIVLRVLRQVHCRHSTTAKLTVDYVRVGECFS
jgi:hypothetical protein